MKIPRQMKLFLITIGITFTIVGIFIWAGHGDDLQAERRLNKVAAIFAPIFALVSIGFLFLFAYVAISLAVSFGKNLNAKPSPPSESQPGGFPVVPAEPLDGPGHFKIDGVDRQTRSDTTVHIEAASAANAKVKAELKGIVVTCVTRE
jgi:hypothetical protein